MGRFGMITVHQGIALECQQRGKPIVVFPSPLISTCERFWHQRQAFQRGAFAIGLHKVQSNVHSTQAASQGYNLNADDANNRTSSHVSVTADQVAANLRGLNMRFSFSLSAATGFMALYRAIIIGGQNHMGHWHRAVLGDKIKGVHWCSPFVGIINIGHLALVQEKSYRCFA
jgi:hypothetical protein